MSNTSTIAQLEERLALYLAAEKAVLEGNQSWQSPDGMVYTRSNIYQIQRAIKEIRNELAYYQNPASFCAQTFVFGGRR
jgi:hypothetical protein